MMTPEMVVKLRKSLVLHEGYQSYPYIDTVGKITIGIGYNLTDRGIGDEWINSQYNKDVSFFYNKLYEDFVWYRELNADRQVILIDMAFMGYKAFCSFSKMIDALASRDFKQAAFEMLNSKWAEQVKGRAATLAQGMLTGVYEV